MMTLACLLIAIQAACAASVDSDQSETQAATSPTATNPFTYASTPGCPTELDQIPIIYQSDGETKGERHVVVLKRERRIGFYVGGYLASVGDDVACRDMNLGPSPIGAKYKRDFASTPEGWYEFSQKRTRDPLDMYPASAYAHGLLVNYPAERDIELARTRGEIDSAKATKMLRSAVAGHTPTQQSAMGGSILVHTWNVAPRNTTWGCIGVDASFMEWLFDEVRVNDPILILPHEYSWSPEARSFSLDP